MCEINPQIVKLMTTIKKTLYKITIRHRDKKTFIITIAWCYQWQHLKICIHKQYNLFKKIILIQITTFFIIKKAL